MSCSGYSVYMGSPNVAAMSRRGDVSWTMSGTITTYSDGTSSFDGTVTLGGAWQGATYSIGTAQFGALLRGSSWQSSGGGSMLHLASTAGPGKDWYQLTDERYAHILAQHGLQAALNLATGQGVAKGVLSPTLWDRADMRNGIIYVLNHIFGNCGMPFP